MSGYNRGVCYVKILESIRNGTLASDDEAIYRDGTGRLMNDAKNLALTLTGCKKLCGSKRMWYSDIGPRLTTWLIPTLLLIGNVDLSPLDKRKFLSIVHLLGDPIDSLWSLVDKIGSVYSCYRLARQYEGVCERCKRVIATVFAGFEELEGPRLHSLADFNIIVAQRGGTGNFLEWRRAAFKLADNRTDEFSRTSLAILLYIFQFIANFIKEVGGGNTSPPGGRIATVAFYSWLLPVVLLSNAIGNFTSRRACYDILSYFVEHTGHPIRIPQKDFVLLRGFSPLDRARSSEYFQSLAWSGGIYTFRPWKFKNSLSLQIWLGTMLLSILAISVGFIGGFMILWYLPPPGFNCRHTWLIGIFVAWVVSAFITSYSYRFIQGRIHWQFVLLKDTVVAVPSITIIFLSACGLFNSCYCWSSSFHGRNDPHVLISTDSYFERKDHTTYPLIVGVCITFQLLLFGIIGMNYGCGLQLFRWSELARSKEWEFVRDSKVCGCIETG